MVEGAKGLPSIIGGMDKAFLSGITMNSVNGTIPEVLWVLFQMTFAIITPALMIGSFVERMKFNAIMWCVAGRPSDQCRLQRFLSDCNSGCVLLCALGIGRTARRR